MKKIIKEISVNKMQPLAKNGYEVPKMENAKAYAYYKGMLSYQEKNAYEQLKDEMMEGTGKIMLSGISSDRCGEVFNAVLLDTPLLFCVNQCNIMECKGKVWIMPKYQMSYSEYRDKKENCIQALQELCSRSKDDWNRLLVLHEKFVKNIRYKEGRNAAHNINGPLLQHEGVCDGIAKCVKAACDMMGIPCIVVRGEARQSNDLIGRHAWNAIKVEHEWRFFDFTFDITLNQVNPCRGIPCMDYFSIGYDEMSADHFKWSVRMLESKSGQDYFGRNGLIVRSQKELEQIICGSQDENPVECAFKVDRIWKNYKNEKALELAVQKLTKKINIGHKYSFMFNDYQRIGYIHIE